MKKRWFSVFLVLGLFITYPCTSNAATFNNLVVFGDSLSDNGNIGRFTDGDIWVETLAASLGANLFDFAYGGATTGYDNPAAGSPITGLQWQVDSFLPAVSGIMDESLFTVWAGANDFLQFRSYSNAVANVGTALTKLYSAGATDILVGNLPDIGATPAFINTGWAGAATGWTLGFNLSLETMLMGFEAFHPDANIYRMNVFDVFADFTPGTQEWEDLFWIDGFHPSSVGHQLIYETAAAAVPEPTTLLLLGVGLIGLTGARRRLKK